MRRLTLVLLALCCAGALSADAVPLCTDADGGITLDRLLSGSDLANGCIVNDKLFDSFSFAAASGGGGTVPTADGITVTPLLSSFNPGLLFTTFLAAGPGEFADITLGYHVSVVSGAPLIYDQSLLIAGGHVGTGIAAVDETVCVGDTGANNCANGSWITLNAVHSGVAVIPFDHASFGPVSSVDVVMKDIGVQGGSNGVATLSAVEQRFSQVPEPGGLALMGMGLLALGLLRRKLWT
jgi:hypothetical protein